MISSNDPRSEFDAIYLASDCFQDLKDAISSISNIRICMGHLKTNAEKYDGRSTLKDASKKSHQVMRIEYDPEKINLDCVLFAFFRIIGLQIMAHRTSADTPRCNISIYYENEQLKDDIERICEIEKERYDIKIKIEHLTSPYIEDGSDCYCSFKKDQRSSNIIVDPADYKKLSKKDIVRKLTPEQYSITQEGMTERPFSNAHYKRKEKGIYVDVVTGEPLFSSLDKFDTSCGWPGFSSAIDDKTILMLNDDSHGMHRTEVRSRTGNSHLGHVFHDDPESPNGTRFCINGASLRFIPFDSMEREGYGYLISIFEEDID